MDKANCGFAGCERPIRSRGLCYSHYIQQRRGKPLAALRKKRPNGAGLSRDAAGRKLCIECGNWLPEDAYWPQAGALDKLHPFCKGCMRTRRHGLPAGAFDVMLADQANGCAICGSAIELHIDHDHACCTGPTSCGQCVRGLLCRRCNSGIGLFEDDPNRLISAAAYLAQARIGASA